MDAPATPRFIQITVAMAPQAANLLYALDEAGGVWHFNVSKKRWARMPGERED